MTIKQHDEAIAVLYKRAPKVRNAPNDEDLGWRIIRKRF